MLDGKLHPGDSFLVWFFVHSSEGIDGVGGQEVDWHGGFEFLGDERRRVIGYFVRRSARPQHASVNGSVGFLQEPNTGQVPGVVAPGHVPRPGWVTSRTDPKGFWRFWCVGPKRCNVTNYAGTSRLPNFSAGAQSTP